MLSTGEPAYMLAPVFHIFPIEYRWLSNGVPIPGATGQILSVPGVDVPRNLLTNGGFESPFLNAGPISSGSFATFSAGSNIDGWVVESNDVDVVNSQWTPMDGLQSLDLNGVSPGAIYQDFITRPGQRYVVSFALAGNVAGGFSFKTCEVWWDDARVDTVDFVVHGQTSLQMNWTTIEYVLTATRDSTRLRFASRTPGNYGPVLDKVRVWPLPSPSPTYTLQASTTTGNVTSAVYRVEYDFSGNGLPDLWELDHFGGFTQSPRADSDGDGVSNLDEYLEQTDPTNAASFHARIILSATAGGTVQVKPFKPFYDLGETVQLTATPNPGGSFDGWTGDVTGNERQRSVVLNRSVQVTGVFGIPILTDGLSAVGNLLASTTNRYAFSAQAGETFILTMANLSETNSSFRPLIRVQDPYGSAIASQVAAPVAVVMQRATTNGVFTVIVESQNLNSEGAYRLAFAKVPHTFELESPGRGEFLTNAVPAIGALTYGGLNLWAFNAKAGDEINLRCGVMQSQRGVFAPDMFVFDPTGELVTHVNGAEEVFSRLTAGTSGRFTVLLKSYFFNPPFLLLDGAGTYRLSFIRVPDPELLATEVSVPFLINGSKVQAVTGLGDVALWLFVANAGDKIVLRSGALSGGFSYRTRLRLFGPDGRSIAEGGSNGDFESYIFQNITTTGVFYLLVDSASLNATGTYTLNYARIPGPYSVGEGDEGGRMSAGQIYFGVNDVADLDLWSFEAVQGRPISLTIQRTSTDPFYDPVLTLFAPTGEVLSSEVFSSIAITPKVSGTYTALVQANRRASVGRYRIFGEGFFSGVRLGSPHIDGPRLTVSGTGGFSDGTFRLMMTTHLNDRLDGWVPVLTNQFDGLGAFQLTIPFLPSLPEQYFKVTVP